MQKVKLYRITTVYVDPYRRDYWSMMPAQEGTHPATGYRYEDLTDGGPVEFWLPDGLTVEETRMGDVAIYDEKGTHLEIVDAHNGEPMVYADGLPTVLKRVED